MSADSYPVRWAGRLAVVAMPVTAGAGTGELIRARLDSVLDREPAVVIVDMTATSSCHPAAADAIARACQRAMARQTEVRLVIPASAVRRLFASVGPGRAIPGSPAGPGIYRNLAAALAAPPPPAATACRAGDR